MHQIWVAQKAPAQDKSSFALFLWKDQSVYLSFPFLWSPPLNEYLLAKRTAVRYLNQQRLCVHSWISLPLRACISIFSWYVWFFFKVNAQRNIAELSAAPLVLWILTKLQQFSVILRPWLDCIQLLSKLSETHKENYRPWGVSRKLHHWQFYLGELQGLDNAPLKYDDRLEGMYPGPVYKLQNPHSWKLKLLGIHRWSCPCRAEVNYHRYSQIPAKLKKEGVYFNTFHQ